MNGAIFDASQCSTTLRLWSHPTCWRYIN